MDLLLYNNASEYNKVNKDLTLVAELTGALRESSSIINPSILIELDALVAFNYAYIPDFGRYYFVNDIICVRNSLFRVSLKVDVLMSFKTEILNQTAIISKNEFKYEPYLPDDNLVTLVKTKTDILNFPSGLLDTGEFILITAGG